MAGLGDEDAVYAAYLLHGAELYRFALRGLGDPGAAQDVTQETFLRAWRAADRFDPELASLRVWLFAIARNAMIDHGRAAQVRPWERHLVDPPTMLEARRDRRRRHRAVLQSWVVEEALQRISEQHREAIVQMQLLERPYDEVAADAGRPRRHAAQPGLLRAQGAARRDGRDGGDAVTDRRRDHQRLRELLGVHALGHLDPATDATVRAHLDGCAACRAELAEIAPLAGLLSGVRLDRVSSPPSPPAGLGTQIRPGRRRGERPRAGRAGGTPGRRAAAYPRAGGPGRARRGGGRDRARGRAARWAGRPLPSHRPVPLETIALRRAGPGA